MAKPPAPSRVPRWMRALSLPLAGLVLTAFFVFLGFPYDLLAERLSEQAERRLNMRIRIGELSPHLSLFGPGLAAEEVLAARPGERTVVVEKLVLRPAWSLAWFRGVPALHLDVTSEIGNGAGTLTVGERGGWTGTLEAVRLEYLPLRMLESLSVEGKLDATVDLHGAGVDAGGGYLGQVDFTVSDGSIATEGLPIPVPFERLFGTLQFGDQSFVRVQGVQLEGPLIAGTIQGEVGHGPAPGREPLDIDVAFEVGDPGLEDMFASLGKPGPDGRRHLSVTGTLGRPQIR